MFRKRYETIMLSFIFRFAVHDAIDEDLVRRPGFKVQDRRFSPSAADDVGGNRWPGAGK
jgi:hypothetical protein